MADRLLFQLAANMWVALTTDELAAARAAAAQLGFGTGTADQGGAAAADEPLVDAEQLAKRLNLPQTRIEQATREKAIPCVRLGRWIRYRPSAVEQALAEGTTL
jgi:excisionase family DNA binding protein